MKTQRYKLYQDKEWLEHEFQTTKYAQTIGKKVGVSGDTIEYWRKKLGIPKPQNLESANRKHIIDTHYFKDIDTEEKAYWLGFLMADGAIPSVGKGKPYTRLSIVLKETDKDHLEKFAKAIKTDYQVKTKEINDKRGFTTYRAEINVNCAEMVKDLISHGVIPQKTGKEIIPELSPELIKHFIRGYFDGDGSISKTSINNSYHFSISSSSYTIIKQISDYLSNIGVELKIKDIKGYAVPFYTIETRKTSTVETILKEIYNNPSIYLDRKYQVVKNFMSAPMRSNTH